MIHFKGLSRSKFEIGYAYVKYAVTSAGQILDFLERGGFLENLQTLRPAFFIGLIFSALLNHYGYRISKCLHRQKMFKNPFWSLFGKLETKYMLQMIATTLKVMVAV